MDEIYITPITRIHSTFADAKSFFDDGGLSFFGESKPPALESLIQGRRNLIVGEPGVGKSLLLEKIEAQLKTQGVVTGLIGLRQTNALKKIDEFLETDGKSCPRALLLDALDEIKSSNFPEVLQKIEDISAQNPDLPIFISGRWVFVSRHANSFPEYRFITISPFKQKQVHDYLTACGYAERDINRLLGRIMSFGHRQLVVQIPRYLTYLHKYIQERGLQAASEVSRNDLFEYFIYNKLRLEEKKLNATKKAIIKRVLEKLALTMEIYQTNVVSEDELMTFFDDTKSELSRAVLGNTEIFYEYSLLKVSEEDLGKIEFENTEFQEYLAAKEITRLKDVVRSTFAFTVDPRIKELYPSWYNALTFLVDMQPDLLEPLIEFSRLRADRFKVMDEAFLTFLSRIDHRVIAPDLRRRIFRDVIAYHERTLQWLPSELAQSMPGLFEASLESYLKERISEAETASGDKRFLTLGNLTYVAGYLLENVTSMDRAYWRGRLLEYVRDKNENGVLQRRALLALQLLGDPSVIDELPDLSDADPLIMQVLLSSLTELAPDHPKSVEYAISATKRNKIHGRYTFFAMKQGHAIKRFLKALIDDEQFLREFMDDTTIFRDQDTVLVDNIAHALDEETRELVKDVLARSTSYNVTHHAEQSTFLSGLWKLLRKGDPTFVTDMIERVRKGKERDILSLTGFLAEIVEKEDVETLIKAMIAAGEAWVAREVMARIRQSGRPNAEEIYEAGRPFLSEGYKELEEAQSRSRATDFETKHAQKTMQKFRFHLEPTPGKFNSNLFEFFNSNVKEIEPLLTPADRERMEKLLKETIFEFYDPGEHDLTIDAQQDGKTTYTTDQSVRIFGDAIQAAKYFGLNVAPYRQKIINLIPFAYNDDLNAIFDLLKDVTPSEMAPVIEVYRDHKSDLWRYNPDSFVQAVERYHVTAAVPVLKEFILEPDWEMYVRRQAIPIVESVAPDAEFLRTIFERFRGSHYTDERGLAEIANGLLITNHNDPDAVQWRLREVVHQAAAFVRPLNEQVHAVSELEDEIMSGKKFAKPLMELKHTGFENDYLAVLDDAMAVWDRGSDYQEYATYLWEIVFAYFDNLKEMRSYMPLLAYEKKVESIRGRDGGNWLAARTATLRRSYLAYLGKPAKIAEAIQKHNDARKRDNRKIHNAADLFQHLQDAFDTDIRRWVEDEGGYSVLSRKISEGRQDYEKLIQQTLKSELRVSLLSRGFDVEFLRESQLLDDKRADFLIRYGFAGPIVVEIKLTSNSDIKGKHLEESPSYESMCRYMRGFGAPPWSLCSLRQCWRYQFAADSRNLPKDRRCASHLI